MKWPWRRKPSRPQHHPLPGWPSAAAYPDSLSDDLMKHLFESTYAVHPLERQRSHWVMTSEWYTECRKITDGSGRPIYHPALRIDGPEILLGLPVVIRAGSGPPHLEPVDVALSDQRHGSA